MTKLFTDIDIMNIVYATLYNIYLKLKDFSPNSMYYNDFDTSNYSIFSMYRIFMIFSIPGKFFNSDFDSKYNVYKFIIDSVLSYVFENGSKKVPMLPISVIYPKLDGDISIEFDSLRFKRFKNEKYIYFTKNCLFDWSFYTKYTNRSYGGVRGRHVYAGDSTTSSGYDKAWISDTSGAFTNVKVALTTLYLIIETLSKSDASEMLLIFPYDHFTGLKRKGSSLYYTFDNSIFGKGTEDINEYKLDCRSVNCAKIIESYIKAFY